MSAHDRASAALTDVISAVCDSPPDLADLSDLSPPDDETLARLAKALAHPARIRIVRLISAHQACITGNIVDEVGLAQSTVSEHLRILRHAGLVQGEIEGPRTRYCVSATGLALLRAGLATL
jgi:ArsR family transcriptional regulator